MQKCNCGGSDNEFKKPSLPVPANKTPILASVPLNTIKEGAPSERIIPFLSDEMLQLCILGGVVAAIILIIIKKC